MEKGIYNKRTGHLGGELANLSHLIWMDGESWINLATLGVDAGHSAIRITLWDGTTIYLDDGNFGGSNHLFLGPELPFYYYSLNDQIVPKGPK